MYMYMHGVCTLYLNDCVEVLFMYTFGTTTLDLKSTGNTGGSSSGKDQNVYKVQEYFQYNEASYYDIDKDMLKYRLEQPRPGEKY